MIDLADIALAQYRIRPHLPPTPVETVPLAGAAVALKLECANRTHSFKIRGALNAALSLDSEARARGLIAASSGNHAQALAYAAHVVGARATIYMPAHTPQKKVDGVRRYGAIPVLDAPNYDEAEKAAREAATREGLTFVSAYNDARVMAGAGTIGLELLQQIDGLKRVIVPVSGGGLIGGVATALKSLNPAIEVIGVCAQHAPAMYNVFHGTTLPQIWETLAEALSGDIEQGSITLEVCRRYVDDVVLVDEQAIATAMRQLLALGWVAEGGGAVGVAALLTQQVQPAAEGKTAIVISGGNVDIATLQRVLAD